MIYTVVGIRTGEFNDKKGELIRFGHLHVTYTDPEVSGIAVELVKANPDLFRNIACGDEIRIDRNGTGRVMAIEKLS